MENLGLITHETLEAERHEREREARKRMNEHETFNQQAIQQSREKSRETLSIPLSESGVTAHILDVDKGLVRIQDQVFCIDFPDVKVKLPPGADSKRLNSFPQVKIPYPGKHFAEMALNQVQTEKGVTRDKSKKCTDVRDILPAYWHAYAKGKGKPTQPKTSGIMLEGPQKHKNDDSNYALIKQLLRGKVG